MKKRRFGKVQIIGVRKALMAGMDAPDLCHRHEISDATSSTVDINAAAWRWRTKSG